jgi:glycosyltransferase involved in cell wall biosynthesis
VTSEPMELRVTFDSYWLDEGPPSGANVALSQIAEWTSAFPGDRVQLAGSPKPQARTLQLLSKSNVVARRRRIKQHGVSNLLELGRGETDVVFAQNFTPLRTRGLSTVFFHDAIFISHPEWFSRAERVYLGLAGASLARADLIFTSSEAEATRIARAYPHVAEKVHAIGLGLSREFEMAEPKRPSIVIEPNEYILVVGRLNVRKNVRRLEDALLANKTISPRLPLVVVGEADGLSDASQSPRIRQAIVDGSIIYAGFVSNAELKWLYGHCRLFTFPSLDEGFGMPVMEAMSCGAALAISDIPAFREFGNVASFFDPTSEDEIGKVVAEAISDGFPPKPCLPATTWQASVTLARSLIVQRMTRR